MSLLTELNNGAALLIYKYFAPNGAGRLTDHSWLRAAVRAEGVIRGELTRDPKKD